MTRARRDRATRALVLALAVALVTPAAAQAQQEQEQLEEIERALREDRTRAETLKRQADKLAQEIQALRVDSVAAARKAQDHEADMSALEAQLTELETQEREKVETLATRRVQLGQTLAALQRIAVQPSEALLLSPISPVDTVRSGMLLRTAIPAIEERAAGLRGELDELQSLRLQIAARRSQLSETAAAQAEDRKRLAALIARKSKMLASATDGLKAAQERARLLATRAKDLRDLMDRVEREAAERAAREQAAREKAAKEAAARAAREAREREARERAAKERAAQEREAQARQAQQREAQEREDQERQAQERQAQEREAAEARDSAPEAQVALAQPPNIRPFPSNGGTLIMPARGRMKTRFGQTLGDGSAARGVVITARKGAQVVAPFDGKVVYAGVFRSYGQILIIEHGGRYHTLLAGMERVDAVVGQWLLAGEPVGILASPRGSGPELYLELRHAGQPINPLPWLATTGDKVRG